MADAPIDNKGVDPKVDAAKDDPTQQVVVGPKDPEHGERPKEYMERVDAGTSIKGPAHLEPSTTHYWGGSSEYRSTGVVPNLSGVPVDDALAAEIKRHADLQRAAVEGEMAAETGTELVPVEDGTALVPVEDETAPKKGFAKVAPPLPDPDNPSK